QFRAEAIEECRLGGTDFSDGIGRQIRIAGENEIGGNLAGRRIFVSPDQVAENVLHGLMQTGVVGAQSRA
ncbi:MAG: hypothetical protein DI607_15205, partial [Sphingomonas hengshuiensis]